MAHENWCGKRCASCVKRCPLDWELYCSPDCPNLHPDGTMDEENCVDCDAYKAYKMDSYYSEQLTLLPDDKNYSKAEYAKEHKISLLDYDCWTHLCDLLGCDITFRQYGIIAESLDEDILELRKRDIPRINRILTDNTLWAVVILDVFDENAQTVSVFSSRELADSFIEDVRRKLGE